MIRSFVCSVHKDSPHFLFDGISPSWVLILDIFHTHTQHLGQRCLRGVLPLPSNTEALDFLFIHLFIYLFIYLLWGLTILGELIWFISATVFHLVKGVCVWLSYLHTWVLVICTICVANFNYRACSLARFLLLLFLAAKWPQITTIASGYYKFN